MFEDLRLLQHFLCLLFWWQPLNLILYSPFSTKLIQIIKSLNSCLVFIGTRFVGWPHMPTFILQSSPVNFGKQQPFNTRGFTPSMHQTYRSAQLPFPNFCTTCRSGCLHQSGSIPSKWVDVWLVCNSPEFPPCSVLPPPRFRLTPFRRATAFTSACVILHFVPCWLSSTTNHYMASLLFLFVSPPKWSAPFLCSFNILTERIIL